MHALARRAEGRAEPLLRHGDIVLNPVTREVTLAGEAVHLSAREFALLAALLARPGKVWSVPQLQERLYGWDDEVGSNTVEVYVHALRKKLGAALIRNIRGVGYVVPRLEDGDGVAGKAEAAPDALDPANPAVVAGRRPAGGHRHCHRADLRTGAAGSQCPVRLPDEAGGGGPAQPVQRPGRAAADGRSHGGAAAWRRGCGDPYLGRLGPQPLPVARPSGAAAAAELGFSDVRTDRANGASTACSSAGRGADRAADERAARWPRAWPCARWRRCCCCCRCWAGWCGWRWAAACGRCARSPRKWARAMPPLAPLATRAMPAEVAPLSEALNQLLARLAQAIDTQRAFVADAAHALRTPLAALQLQAQLVERADGAEAGRRRRGCARTGAADPPGQPVADAGALGARRDAAAA